MSAKTHPFIAISDLHLCEERPETVRCLMNFLKTTATEAESLYILGDFFEFWAGDDLASEFHLKIAAALKSLSQAGTNVFIMRGNRDVILGKGFCKLANATFIQDPTLITINGEKILLAHGDAYCTDDKPYMRYRRIVNNPLMQKLFLSLPKSWRLKIAKKIRQSSQKNYASKPTLIDVNPKAIEKAMSDAGVKTLIHGHTHQLAIHNLSDKKQRVVLGDWHTDGNAIVINTNGPSILEIPPKN